MKNWQTSVLLFLLLITALAVFDTQRASKRSEETNIQNQKLVEQISDLEKKLEHSNNISDELEKKNKRLLEDTAKLEDEIKLRESIDFQAFMDAINTIESYKMADTFNEARKYISYKVGISTKDRQGTCPCKWGFESGLTEWNPHIVMNLRTFTAKKEEIILTYSTKDEKHDYQFVLLKEEGHPFMPQSKEGWKIKNMEFVDK